MKKIVLYGDSIRLGYQAYVEEAFAGVATVYYPNANCGLAQNLLRYAHEYKQKGEWPEDIDVVHWNAGLWDVLRLFGDEPLSSPEAYADMIARLDRRMRMLFPKARFIFATSTSIVEAGYTAQFSRKNADIEEYNRIACRVLEGTGTIINDLYPLTCTLPPEARSDMTHFNNDLGCRYLGSWVTSAIAKVLDIDLATLPKVDAKASEIAADILGY